jgi:hypothetical protein
MPRRATPSRSARDAATLGRVFSLRRESWALTDDPGETRPQVVVLASRRTAAEAADLAREAAAAFSRYGFHKPSGCWWAADATRFHRFRVSAARPRPGLALAVVSTATGLAIWAALRPRRDLDAG